MMDLCRPVRRWRRRLGYLYRTFVYKVGVPR